MKRIIKFRAYTEISNEVLGMKYDVPHNYNDTVMQFTGLLDRNGKEIYEHDVILLKDKDYEEKNETLQALSTYEFHCVEFENGCFKIDGVNLGDYVDSKYLDIIQCGNIYENKEVYRVEEKILSHGEDMNITDPTKP